VRKVVSSQAPVLISLDFASFRLFGGHPLDTVDPDRIGGDRLCRSPEDVAQLYF
jgi:hypothetical protein